MLLTALTLTLLSDVMPRSPDSKTTRRPAPECAADGDCVLSTFNGCCPACCGSEPHAVPRGRREGELCAVVECAAPNCAAVRCAATPGVDEFQAVCQAGRCVARPKVAECRQDTDCRVVQSPLPTCTGVPCGCCPVTRAVPADQAQPRPAPLRERQGPSTPPPSGEKPTFGLSTGSGAPRPQPATCSPCPEPQPGRAACQAGRCTLQPVLRRPPPPG